MYRQLTQILAAARLISRAQGASVKELQEDLGISRRSVYRLFNALDELGYPLFDVPDGRERRYKLNEVRDSMRWWLPVPKVLLSFEDRVMLDYLFREAAEAPALAKAAGELRRKVSSLIADGGYSLADKEQGAGPSLKRKPVILHAAMVNKRLDPDGSNHLKTILRSISEKSVCVVSYEAINSGEAKTYRIHPLALFEHEGGVYLFVVVPYYGTVRILALERIRSIELTEDGFEPPADFDPEARLADPFGIILNDQFTARVRFGEGQAAYIREREWPSGARIDEEEDGSIVLSVETGGAYELKRWVMSFGSEAELLEPAELRAEIAEELSAAAALYEAELPGGEESEDQ